MNTIELEDRFMEHKFHKTDKNKTVKMSCCPNCGGGDVSFCNISVRPYCNDCSYWGSVNFGTKEDSIQRWNEQYHKNFD